MALQSIDGKIIIQAFWDNIILCHGVPRRFLSDTGSSFRSNLMKEVSYIINIYKIFASSYNLQCEGFIHPTNGTLTQIIAMHVGSSQKGCNTCLKFAVYVHNTSLSETIEYTPFFLTYGHEPIKLPDVLFITGMSIRVCQSQQREND